MRILTSAALAAVILATQIAEPPAVAAASAERTYQLQTRIVEQPPSVGEFDGLLQLQISAKGIVSGFYRPDDNERFVPVTGGVNGERFWLDIGSLGLNATHFTGVFKNGKIDAESARPFLDDGRYTTLELIGAAKPA